MTNTKTQSEPLTLVNLAGSTPCFALNQKVRYLQSKHIEESSSLGLDCYTTYIPAKTWCDQARPGLMIQFLVLPSFFGGGGVKRHSQQIAKSTGNLLFKLMYITSGSGISPLGDPATEQAPKPLL